MSNLGSFFEEIFLEKQEFSRRKLEEYIAEPGETQIHEFRKSVRRLESAYLIFPKSYKKKKLDRLVSSYKSLFQKSNIIRDYDIIYNKLLEFGLKENSEPLKFIQKQRSKNLKTALKFAKKISNLKISKIKKSNPEKFEKKYDKTISQLISKIQEFIPIVASDESKVDELHSMRKTAKKLRYILEIKSNSHYQRFIGNMKAFQERLGKIHDCDMTICFLKKYKKKFSELEPLIVKEQEFRTQIYQQLAKTLSEKK